MGAEQISLSDMFDATITLKKKLESLHPGLEVSIEVLTDSKTLFDVISKGTQTSEKRLMIDVACALEDFGKLEITEASFKRFHPNLADGLAITMN